MDASAFSSDSPGTLVRAPQGHMAFVPDALPPNLKIDSELAMAMSDADRAIGELAGVGRRLPNPHLLIRPFLQREAVLSSRIEGTQSSISDLIRFEADPTVEQDVPDVREVRNYVEALELGLKKVHELPLSLRLIRDVHRQLLEGVRGGRQRPGEFRTEPNWIGPPGCTMATATYVPPPHLEMDQNLRDFERFLHASTDIPPLLRFALIHYQFEAIHPFLDGNGRIGRLLIVLLLCVEKVLPQPLLYLSAYFEKHRQEYYDHLLSVSQHGRWKQWCVFFLRGVSEQALDAVRRSNHLLGLQASFRTRCRAATSSPAAPRLIDNLFSSPVTWPALAQETLGVTRASARSIINKLEKAGILQEVTGRKRNRVYFASEIVEAIQAPQAPE